MSDYSGHPVIAAAKARREDDVIVTLSTGVRARYKAVPPVLIGEVATAIKTPPVPRVNRGDGVEIENPADPAYLAAIEQSNVDRNMLIMDAFIMFGIELVDGVPEDDGWLRRIQLMAKRGGVDLSGYDLDNPVDREFVYKKYVAVSSVDLGKVGEMSRITGEDIEASSATFPSD